MTGAAAGVAFVITSCFAPYPPVQRIRELQPLLAKWSIGAPPRHRNVSEEDYCKGLINRLAIRIATITQVRQAVHGAADGSRHASQLGTGSVANALAHMGGSAGGGDARPGWSTLDAPVHTQQESAMREGDIFRRSLSGLRARLSAAGTKKQRRSAATVRWGDEVVPFAADDPCALSTDSNHAFGNFSATGMPAGRPSDSAGLTRRSSEPDGGRGPTGERGE
ncbi:hypothetical protein NESM_000921300 [Novymonas esmeraldas]|uniref:Uncharacterized protein n=1 Tax=Novymonas esmeraldas TaxID=1808958 RepID=A0AAW0EYQ3_9TRYP